MRLRAAIGGCAPGRAAFVALPVGLVMAMGSVAGCGESRGSSPVDPLVEKIGQARDAQARSSVRAALATAKLVYADQGSYGSDAAALAEAMSAQDSSVTYTTGLSGGPTEVQVIGGGEQPLMLVARSGSGAYEAIWDDGGATFYYDGSAAPSYTVAAPAQDGWSAMP